MVAVAGALPPRGRLIRIVAKAAGAIVIAFVAFMALAHTSAGRKIMSPLYVAKCPVAQVSAADIEKARVESARLMAGDKPAATRPALGFTLEKTQPAELHAWAKKHGVACKDEREGALVRCSSVPQGSLEPALDGPPLSEVLFAFEPKGMTLVNMSAYMTDVPEEVAAARAKRVEERLKAGLGAPESQAGAFEAAYLTASLPAVASTVRRKSDYHATVTITRFKAGQVMLREHYMAGVPAGEPPRATP